MTTTHSIVFLTTQICNLNCKYCFLANTKINENSYYLQEQEKINQALKDRSYINNYITAIKRLGKNPLDISNVEIWGQEPTINLELFMENFDYLYKNFPNINKLIFSSNGIQNINKLLDAVKIMNKVINKPFLFSLQFSFDGMEYTKINRGIDPNIIINNVYYFIEELNKIKLKEDFRIDFHFHNVLGKNLMTSLQTQKEIEQFWKEISDFTNKAVEKINNPQVSGNSWIYPAIESPMKCSKEEGILISNFLSRSLQSDYATPVVHMFENVMKHFNFANIKYDLKVRDLIKIVKEADLLSKSFTDCYEILSRSCSCGTQCATLKMDYKGELVYCQNVLFKKDKNSFKNIETFEDQYFYSLVSHNRYPNILTDDIKDIENYFNFYENYAISGFGQKFSNTLSLMMWMADCNLISPIYKKNTYKLLTHAMILSTLQNCPHNDIIDTGSIYGRSTGLIKTYCNGVLSLIDDLIVGNDTYKFITKAPKTRYIPKEGELNE